MSIPPTCDLISEQPSPQSRIVGRASHLPSLRYPSAPLSLSRSLRWCAGCIVPCALPCLPCPPCPVLVRGRIYWLLRAASAEISLHPPNLDPVKISAISRHDACGPGLKGTLQAAMRRNPSTDTRIRIETPRKSVPTDLWSGIPHPPSTVRRRATLDDAIRARRRGDRTCAAPDSKSPSHTVVCSI